ncbi:MAG: hypothetical protein PHU85_18375 [Phycisphaerae bacterium]|nr:hypothetical protein [Phycisphaerae bacterium]
MSKRELINRIQLFNPTAGSRFLRDFDEADLTRYLHNLEQTTPPARLLRANGNVESADSLSDPRQLALVF